MRSEEIEKILDEKPNEFFEDFCEVLVKEIISDTERPDKKGRQLFIAALESSDPDSFFMAISGWSLNTLIGKAELQTTED